MRFRSGEASPVAMIRIMQVQLEVPMKLCPVAIAVGCSECPIVRICPAKGIIGDYKPEPPAKRPAADRKSKARSGGSK
jgi:hypothetical protein